MEFDRLESVPFLKQEPSEFSLNYLCPDNRHDQGPRSCDKSCHIRKGAYIPSSLPSTSVVPSQDDTNVRTSADANVKEDDLPSHVMCSGGRISESFSSLRSESRSDAEGPSLYSSSPSCNVPAIPQECSLGPLDMEEPLAAQSFKSQLDDQQNSSHSEKAADSRKNIFRPSERVESCNAIPVEELSAFKQISLKTGEVFRNGGEKQFFSNGLSETVSVSIDNGIKSAELMDKFDSEINTSTENLKETRVIGSIKPIEDAPIFSCNREKNRGRSKKVKFSHIEEAPMIDHITERETMIETTVWEEDEKQNQSSPNDSTGDCFRKIPSKVCERKRALQNKSTSVSSSVLKPCRIQIQTPAEKKLFQGLGVKRFHCTVCLEYFNQSQELRRHVREMHEGQPYSKDNSFQPSVLMTFTCPLCYVSYSRKYGLKRHFANKHFNTPSIPCPECKYKAKTLAAYLKHIEKHKPKQTEAPDAPIIQESVSHNSQLKCRDCFKLFQSSDALRLHVIDHKITLCLSQVESFLPSEKISNCASSEAKSSTYSSRCALLMPSSNSNLEEVYDPSLLSCLHQELKLEVEHSLNTIFKLASRLEHLARSLNTLNTVCTSSVSQTSLSTINYISTLSAGLTNLSTALGHVLRCHFRNKDEKDTKAYVDDLVEEVSDIDTEAVEERKKVNLESDEKILQQRLEANRGELAQKNEEIFHRQDDRLFQQNKEQTIVVGNEEATFQEECKELAQENNNQVIVKKKDGEIFQEKCVGLAQENYERFVLEEVEDLAFVKDLVIDRHLEKKVEESMKGTSLGESFTLRTSRRKPRKSESQTLTFESSKIQTRRSESQTLTFESSKIQTRRSERHALKLKASIAKAKTSVQQIRATSKHSKAEVKHPRRGQGHLIFKKLLEDHRSSKSAHGYTCRECGKNFSNFAGLKRHLMIHSDFRPFKCMVCKMSFRCNDHLNKHVVVHSDERPFKCDVCDYAAKTAKTLHNHSLTHGQHQRFPCKKCSYKGRTVYELSKHEEKHKPCPLCSYVASDVADYTMHKRSHVIYSCTECSYSCYANWQLKRHSLKHKAPGDVEKLCCKLCGYSCTDKRRLAYHMTRHENKTPLSCSVCDYKCSSQASFDAHKLMHAGLKPYLCSICGASFRRPSTLNNHMLIHKEEKNHVCRTCGRPFRARHNLRVHEMIHTGERKFKCQLCSFACRRKRELAMHMSKHKVLDGKEKDSHPSDSQCDSKAD